MQLYYLEGYNLLRVPSLGIGCYRDISHILINLDPMPPSEKGGRPGTDCSRTRKNSFTLNNPDNNIRIDNQQ